MIEKIIKKRAKRSSIWQMPLDELKELVKNSNTIGSILKAFGMRNQGSNYRTLKRRLDEENVDYSHIRVGFGANKGRKFDIKPLDFAELFRENSPHSRGTVKRYIVKNNLIPYKCSICGFEGKWQEKDLVLVLDHINGVNNDHRLENLRFLCPNCNSQQDTFAGRNLQKRNKKCCAKCGKEICKKSTYCISCSNKRPRINTNRTTKKPSKSELLNDISTMSNVKIGLKYNVSETAVRKWRKFYNI